MSTLIEVITSGDILDVEVGAGIPVSIDVLVGQIVEIQPEVFVGIPGEKGEQGEPGSNGANGTNGANGSPGSVWRSAVGVPSNSLGINGDYYLNNTTGDVYIKAAGVYSVAANIKGPIGVAGANGTNGADGAPGAVWRSGAGVPSNALGINGDYYLNNSTGDVYLKASGAYAIATNIKGPAGANGSNGTNGAAGATGPAGPGLPTGGVKGQIAKKNSGTDYDFAISNNDNDFVEGAQFLGSPIKAINLGGVPPSAYINSAALTQNQCRIIPVYLKTRTLISGLKWMQTVNGNYTAHATAYCGFGLYSYSAGVLTKVAETGNDSTTFSSAANLSVYQSKAFQAAVTLDPGVYFVVIAYAASAQVTGPALVLISGYNAGCAGDYPNNVKLCSTISAVTTMPATINFSTTSLTTVMNFLALY